MKSVPQQQQNKRPDPVLGIVFPILLVFLFAIYTGLPEMVGFLRATRPIFMIGILGLIAVAVTGKFVRVLSTPIGKTLTVFTIWFLICIPLAIWRGGSFKSLMDYWSKSYLAYVLVAGLVSTTAEAKKAFHSIAYGVAVLAVLALIFRTYSMDGRLSMPGGRYGNANDLAWTLLAGLIFITYMYLQGNIVRKVLALALAAPVLLALSKTGSRALLVGIAVLFLYAFAKGSGATKAKLIVLVPVLLVAVVMVMPKDLRERYTTLFGKQNTQETAAQVDAAGSSEARLELLEDSLYITAMHPIFGVGPGNFEVAQSDLAIARGEGGGMWHVTHNSYTQLSSEVGIPGLIIYVVFLFQCWRVLSWIMRRRYMSKDLRLMAATLQAALLVMATVAFFDSFAYDVNLPIVAGLITALSFIAQRQKPVERPKTLAEEAPAPLPEPEYEPAWSGRMY